MSIINTISISSVEDYKEAFRNATISMHEHIAAQLFQDAARAKDPELRQDLLKSGFEAQEDYELVRSKTADEIWDSLTDSERELVQRAFGKGVA